LRIYSYMTVNSRLKVHQHSRFSPTTLAVQWVLIYQTIAMCVPVCQLQCASKNRPMLHFQTTPTHLVQCQQFMIHRNDIKIFSYWHLLFCRRSGVAGQRYRACVIIPWIINHLIKPQSNGPGQAAAPPSPLLAVPNVPPSTVSVPTSYYSMWHYNYLCTVRVKLYFERLTINRRLIILKN